MDWGATVPFLALGLSALTAGKSFFVSREAARREARLTVLEKQMEVFWGMVEQHMTTVLHSPHTPLLDALLEKYQAGAELEPDEISRLAYYLEQLINDPKESQGNRTGAVFLLAALDVRYRLNLEDPC